ncbi:MAG TPA: DUF72 domain-containing protein [Pyrinomonadaceae bacterium]|nr:DUF72 domain-containing protein [Pyrinomonadaceae bacterium]
MKFGQVANPEEIDFTIPPDHPDTTRLLEATRTGDMEVYVGCAKWNKKELQGFYPKGTKDELAYYSSQFNAIELNATFRRRIAPEQYKKWADDTPDGFKFCPKMGQFISHIKRLADTAEPVELFATSASHMGEKLGVPYLQMHDNFGPEHFARVEQFAEDWQYDIPVALELRKTDWHTDPFIKSELYDLLERSGIANVLVDTAGRRDLMHMRLTTPTAFVRWVGANHDIDYARMDEWIERIAAWKAAGLSRLFFFLHQNVDINTVVYAKYFIPKLNERIGTNVHVPEILDQEDGAAKSHQ